MWGSAGAEQCQWMCPFHSEYLCVGFRDLCAGFGGFVYSPAVHHVVFPFVSISLCIQGRALSRPLSLFSPPACSAQSAGHSFQPSGLNNNWAQLKFPRRNRAGKIRKNPGFERYRGVEARPARGNRGSGTSWISGCFEASQNWPCLITRGREILLSRFRFVNF